MRTITSVVICVAVALVFMPGFRHDAGRALSRVTFLSTVVESAEEGGHALVKAVNAVVEDVMPSRSDEPPGAD